MGERKEAKTGWGERRREKKRVKQERTGDSPEKRTEPRRKSSDPGPDGAAGRAGTGNVAGGGIL